MNAGAIPLELRERPQWVCWKREERDGKGTKVPYRADGVGRASSTDPATWASFELALAAAETLPAADGIGYVFSLNDPFVGVDLDADLGEADRGAIMLTLDSYAETSVSGNGVHVLVRASLNGYPRNRRGPIEVYDAGRYFVVTGEHVVGTPTRIEERQAELEDVLARFLPEPERTIRLPEAPQPLELDDHELIERAMGARNGAKFKALWRGETGGYGSHSEADLALASLLAFWTGGDAVRVDQLFRSSGLYRPKWERSDYRKKTLERALTEGARARPAGSSPSSSPSSSLVRPDRVRPGVRPELSFMAAA